jgi:hypothetical protein
MWSACRGWGHYPSDEQPAQFLVLFDSFLKSVLNP